MVTHQAPSSMGFPRQEYWSGLLFPSPGDLPNPGIEPKSPALAGGFFTAEPYGIVNCILMTAVNINCILISAFLFNPARNI